MWESTGIASWNGTAFGGVVDPRMSRMLSPSPDGQFRGLDINTIGFGALTAAQQPNNFHGFPGTGGVGVPGRYLFDDKAKIPLITYAELQFVKAEAAMTSQPRIIVLRESDGDFCARRRNVF